MIGIKTTVFVRRQKELGVDDYAFSKRTLQF